MSAVQGRWAGAGSGSAACAHCRRCTTAWCTAWAAGKIRVLKMSWQTAPCVRYATCLHPSNHGSSDLIFMMASRSRKGINLKEAELAQGISAWCAAWFLWRSLLAKFRSERKLETGMRAYACFYSWEAPAHMSMLDGS